MAEITIKSIIIPRHDSAAKWVEANPVLKSGEIGIEIDTNLMKIGDGISDWNTLQYAVSSLSEEEILEIFKE